MNRTLRSRSKYGAKKITAAIDGQTVKFDSKKEYERFRFLRHLEAEGQIKNLQRQVVYELIPAQRNETGKVVERSCKYIADFVYDTCDGERIVEDAKGIRAKEYIIKRKLMLYIYGIEVQEV